MVLSMSTFIHNIVVLGPSRPSSPQDLVDILRYGKVDGALLVPAMIECVSIKILKSPNPRTQHPESKRQKLKRLCHSPSLSQDLIVHRKKQN